MADAPLTPETVREALREVKAPGTKVDIVRIDLVGEIRVEGDRVAVQIVQTSEKDETIAAVKAAAEERLRRLPGVGDVEVTVRRELPAAKPRPPHNPDPWADRARLPGVKRILAVASAKGGVGKSTVAVNLALALKEAGHRVGLLDADIYGPSLPTLLGTREVPRALDDRTIVPVEVAGLQAISMGMLLDEGQAVIWRGPMVMAAVKQFLKDVRWDGLDYLVIDMPPGTGDAQLTLVQQVPVDGVVMVTTPQELALADVRRGIQMFRQVATPVAGIVENMSWFECGECGTRHYLFGKGGGARVARDFDVPLLGEIPFDPDTREGGDAGRPVVTREDHPARRIFLELAERVRERVPVGGE